ncbi:MAG: hypothetical protein AB7L18_05335, partial [Hyphomicrobiaceae bacterium]
MTRPPTAIAIVALGRSGHHAFIEWLVEARARPVVFFKNVIPSIPPPARSAPILYNGAEPLPGGIEAKSIKAAKQDLLFNF